MLTGFLKIFPLILITSCAFSNLTVTPPKDPINSNLHGGNHRNLHVIVPMNDSRMMRYRCGMQKNGWNMDTANVNCLNEPAQWIAELLTDELRNSGFTVTTGTKSNSNAIILEGQLLQFFVEPKVDAFTFTPEADIHVRLVASSQSGLLAEREFYVKGMETSMVGAESNFQKASDAAVRQIIRNMVSAVLNLMNRYPDLGTEKSSKTTT